MERNREGRRMAAANGLSRRRQRSSGLRDSPEEDGAVELQETARLRDRGNKKDRDRDRDRLSRSRRRRGDRLMHGSNREEGEDSSEESVDDDEEDEDEDAAMVRMLPPNPASSSSITNHHPQRKSFPPAKVIRTTAPILKVADEMIGVSVPRKARTASAKRPHESWVSGGGDREQIHHRQASTSPARPSIPVSSSAPISPSSNSSVRKKMKSLGPKLRPPKVSKASSIQDDIEIEVAEVLYIMRQSHSTSKQEAVFNASEKLDLKDSTGTSNDVKSRVPSPISNSPSAAPLPPVRPQNSNSSTTPSSAMAPKRKKPRPVKEEDENSTIVAIKSVSNSVFKNGIEQLEKIEISSQKLKKSVGSERENGGVSFDLGISQAAPVSTESQPAAEPVGTISDSKLLTVEDGIRTKEDTSLSKCEPPCGKMDVDLEYATSTKPLSGISEAVSKREEKFKIDLMASPPSKSSPDRDGLVDFVPEPKPAVPDVETDQKMEPVLKNEERMDKSIKQDSGEVGLLEKRLVPMAEELEPQKLNVSTQRVSDTQLDLEKQGLDSGDSTIQAGKQEESQKLQQSKSARTEPKIEKSDRYTSLPLPMTVAGWPGALPPLGYSGQVPPLQGIMPLDGGGVGSSNAIQPSLFPFSQTRPKKCATHCYIAQTIQCHQQFIRMNFWPAAAGSAALCGTKPYNLNIVPSADNAIVGNPMTGLFPGRVNSNTIQEKSQVTTSLSNHAGKEKSSVAVNYMDSSQQRKQLVLQQGSQPAAAAGNLLHAPAFIFQQQAAVAVATKSGPVKSGSTGGNTVLSSASNSAPGLQGKNSSTAAAAASNMSFTYPNLPANEAQYLAFLQNNGYPFPIPSHVGAPPPYRGTHAQAIPFFNGSFYSSPMLHPSHLQKQQQTQSLPQPAQLGHQNTSTSTGSSSSHKHQHNQQQMVIGGSSSSGAGNSHNFSTSKNPPPQKQVQQQQQNQHISIPNQAGQHESDMGADGRTSTSTVDGRVSHAHKSIYGQNFPLPIHTQNFALMSPATFVSGNHGEKQLQQQGLKGGMELIPSQAFAMSFASFGGAVPGSGIDFSSMVQNHAIFQSLPEATRQGYQIAAAAAAAQTAQQKLSHQMTEEGRAAGDSVNMDEDRKGMAAKGQASVGQSLVFSRLDSSEQSASTLGNTVVDSSTRTLNLISASVNTNSASRLSSATTTSTASAAVNLVGTELQQQQLMIQLQKQHQTIQQLQLQQQLAAVSATRSKQSTTTSASVFSDCLPSSSSMSSKLPNGLSVFPQALMQGGSPMQSPQWKNSVRAMTSSAPSLAPAASSLKNLSQQQGRTQQGHSQISFGVNSKSSTTNGQQLPSSSQSASPPIAVGSPTSVSKSAGGSPRATSVGSKVVSAPTLSSQQAKNSQSVSSRKSSPVCGRNVPSIISNTQVSTTSSSAAKPQSQQQQQLQKQSLQQAQLFFPNAYMQAQSLQSSATATTSIGAGYYNQRRQPEQQQQQIASIGSPLALTSASAADPTKAIPAAAANNMKGVLPLHTPQFAPHSSVNSHPLVSNAFSYIHSVPAVPVKPAEHKQPAGNDNLRASWQPEKS